MLIEDGGDGREIDRDFVGQAVDDRHRRLVARNVRVIAARQLPMGALDFVCAASGDTPRTS